MAWALSGSCGKKKAEVEDGVSYTSFGLIDLARGRTNEGLMREAEVMKQNRRS